MKKVVKIAIVGCHLSSAMVKAAALTKDHDIIVIGAKETEKAPIRENPAFQKEPIMITRMAQPDDGFYLEAKRHKSKYHN